jgi:anti-sigma-K factor RskA
MVEQQNQPNKHVDDLIDAYALGILEDEAVAEVERHLEGCPNCRQALQRAREVVELLAFAPRQTPPPTRLKQRILSRIAQESQSGSAPASAQAQEGRAAEPASTVSIPLPEAAPIRQGMVESMRQWFGGRRSEPPPLASMPGREQTAEQQLQMVLRVLHTPHAAIWDLSGTPEAPNARAALLGSPETDTAVLVVSGLAPLPPERDYQLWFLREGHPVGSAVFDVGQSGEGQLVVRAPRQLGHYDLAAITPEPAGGSAGPTGPIMIAGQIKAA